MLSTPGFAEHMAGAVLFVHVTSKVESDPHQELLREKGGFGFPYLVVMDPEGNVLGRPGSRDVDAFERLIGKAAHHLDLTKRAREGDESVAFELFLSRMRLGMLGYAKARAEQKKYRDLSDDQKAALERQLLELRVNETCAAMRTNKDRVEAGALFFKLWKKKLVPQDPDAVGPFWEQITYYAERKRSIRVFREAMEQYAAHAADGHTKDSVLELMQKRLQKLRS